MLAILFREILFPSPLTFSYYEVLGTYTNINTMKFGLDFLGCQMMKNVSNNF